jgi:hypothetical protein
MEFQEGSQALLGHVRMGRFRLLVSDVTRKEDYEEEV